MSEPELTAADVVHFHDAGEPMTPCGLDVWQDPEEEDPGSYVSSTTRHGSVTCEACRATFTTAPADVSPVLDLIDAFADDCASYAKSGEQRYAEAASLTHDRIAALLPQYPVQARSRDGLLWWIHDCGTCVARQSEPQTNGCPYCGQDAGGRWLPLLVGGHPAPATKDFSAAKEVQGGGLTELLAPQVDPEAPARPDLIAQVMAELGVDRPEDVLPYIRRERRLLDDGSERFGFVREQRDDLRRERDEARAAIERHVATEDALVIQRDEARAEATDYAARLKATDRSWAEVARERDEARAELQQHLALRDEAHAELRHHLDSVDRLAGERNEARAEVERCQRLLKAQASNFSAAYNKLAEATPAQSDPLVLSLPTVPEGAVALVGAIRYERSGDDPHTLWRHPSGVVVTLGEVFDNERADGDGTVRVEMAPPREPRTWPKLDKIPVAPWELSKVEVEGHGTWFRHQHREADFWHQGDDSPQLSFAGLMELGAVTEVFDEPGGAR